MNTERLELMITLLTEVIEGRWAPKVFPQTLINKVPDPLQVEIVWHLATFGLLSSEAPACGFAACAVGHACLDQRFVDLGLCYDKWNQPTVLVPVEGDEPEELRGFYAVAFFFDIPDGDAALLFSPDDGYETAEDVRHALRVYINTVGEYTSLKDS